MSLKVENVVQDVRYACRAFLRTPLTAATIIVTVGLGLGLVAAIFTILSSVVFGVDRVRNPEELFGVERQRSAIAGPETFTLSQYETLLRETDVFSDAFANTSDFGARIDGIRREGHLVTGNFFDVLGVGAGYGRVFTPADDEAGQQPVMVLSHRAWVQYYASDPGVIERTVQVNATNFQIIGVMREGFRGLEVFAAPDFWAPLSQIAAFPSGGARERSADALSVIGRLKPGLSPAQATAQLMAWDSQRFAERSADQASLVLVQQNGTVPQAAQTMIGFIPLFFAFGLILMIGCANVANLLLARLFARQREIGIRLAIGASRLRVVCQLVTENLLLALVAAALGFAISRIALNGVVYWITNSFPDIGNLRLVVPSADWRVGLFLVAGAIVSTVLFALWPALRATRQELTRAIHGQVTGESRPGRVRNVLVVLQVAGSALLLICTAIFLRGAWSSATVDPGFRIADTISVSVLDEAQRARIIDSVVSDPSVAAVAAAWPGALGGAPAYAEGAGGRSVVTFQFVSPNYMDVLEVDLMRGRGFDDNERNLNDGVAVVSESVARELWPGTDALGQVLRIEPDRTIVRPGQIAANEPHQSDDSAQPEVPMMGSRTVVVVGVARDVAGIQIAGTRIGGAGVYMPVSAETPGTALVARVRGSVEVAHRGLVDRLALTDPNMADLSMLQTLARTNAYLLGTSFWLTLVLGALALLLTLSGLFSVLSYLVEQRTREIGVRMALGASRRKISGLVLLQSARPVGIGLLLGGASTVGLATLLLATPAAEQIAATVRLFDPIAYAASLLCIIVACAGAALLPALRAGRLNPLDALRQD